MTEISCTVNTQLLSAATALLVGPLRRDPFLMRRLRAASVSRGRSTNTVCLILIPGPGSDTRQSIVN